VPSLRCKGGAAVTSHLAVALCWLRHCVVPLPPSSPPVVIPSSSCHHCLCHQCLCHCHLCRHPCHHCSCHCRVILPLLSSSPLFVAVVSASLSIGPRLPSCEQLLAAVEMGAGVVVVVSPFCGSSGASWGCHPVAPAFHPASSRSQWWRLVLGPCCCVMCFVPPPDIFNLKDVAKQFS
jgi:hypothetical protein